MRRVLLTLLVCSALGFPVPKDTIQKVDQVLDQIADMKETLLRKKEEILRSLPEGYENKIREIENILDKADEIEQKLLEYKGKLKKGKKDVPYVPEEGNIDKVLKTLLGVPSDKTLDADLEYSGKEGIVLAFSGPKGKAFVFGRYEEYFFEGEGETKFTPKWGVVIFYDPFVLLKEDEGKCYYTGNTWRRKVGKCPDIVSLTSVNLLDTDGEKLYLTGIVDRVVGNQIVSVEMLLLVTPEGISTVVSSGYGSFPLYVNPEVEIDSLSAKIPDLDIREYLGGEELIGQ